MTELLGGLDKNLPILDAVFAKQKVGKVTGGQVELIVASAGHQLFGLLMSQVSSILRPGPAGLEVLTPPAPPTRLYGELVYQNGGLRVLELSRQLFLPLVEPIERCKILLTGPLQTDNKNGEQFGVAVDDVITLRRFNVTDLRLLPAWLCTEQLGKLVWGVVLVEPETLALDNLTSALPTPFKLEVEPFHPPIISLEAATQKPVRSTLSLVERLAQRERRVEQLATDNRRPLVLLDLRALYPVAFP